MSFFKSAFIISFFTLLSRIFGFIRDILIAKYLGAGFLSDVFFAAFRFPNFFRRIFAEGAFNSAFVPIFSGSLALGDKKDSAKFALNIFSILLISLLVFTFFIELFMPAAMHVFVPGFVHDSEKFELSIKLARITFPYLFFISLTSLSSGILNSLNKFAMVSATPIILNLVFIFFMLFLNDYFENTAYTLSYAVFVAGILQFFWLYIVVLKNNIILRPVRPRLTGKTREFFSKFVPGIIGGSVAQINVLVDVIMATLIPGAVSYLYYADRIVQFPLALIGTAIGIAILPALSKEVQTGNFEEAQKTQNLAFEISMFFVIPIAIATFIFSKEVISILFERGMFGHEEVIKVAKAIMVYALGLPAFVLAKIITPSFFARKDTKTPMYIAIVCLFVNVFANLIFMKVLGYLGIALATILSSWVNVVLLMYVSLKREDFIFSDLFKLNLLKIIYNSAFVTLVILALRNSIFDYMFNSGSKSAMLYAICIVMTISGIVYLYTSYLTGLVDMDKIKVLFVKKSQRKKVE